MAIDREAKSEETMVVQTIYDEEPRRYDSIINTTTLAYLQRVDVTDLGLSPTLKIALRTLHYDSATKVAIKFNSPWWITQFGITEGGVADTDLPIRVW
jgi:monoamine oxidase